MTGLLTLTLVAAVWVAFLPSGQLRIRIVRALQPAVEAGSQAMGFRRRDRVEPLPLTVLVQQLSALLRGGRSASKLWDELWMVHGAKPAHGTRGGGPEAAALGPGSLQVLAAARAASMMGTSVAEAIRTSAGGDLLQPCPVDRRVWGELAACLDVAEASGCPLADVLTRFASQLEAEDDADDARQTALAGPKATVRLLTWLPIFGLALGLLLGVDPFSILLANGVGWAALAGGIVLTIAGRVWSSRLVRAAAGGR
ncbi:type II secretion system F family protein [Arthrobacter sp. NyZ413]|uniref:type II secretion system F family protein n=1 Tax=Arthrobacter sp. NyZ413 TaxID=3144669 RepID=UPI003BF8A519